MIVKVWIPHFATFIFLFLKKEAEKIRNDGRKNRRIRNRKAKNILKIVKRLLETRLEAKIKKTIVDARPEEWNRKIKKSKMWKDNRKKTKHICGKV